jgi:two-component system alkaline phosphatase synthesis response regulator PhoP
MPKILLVEDDEAMAVGLRDGFGFEGYQVSVAEDGETALRMAADGDWDLMILDVMLPKMSGLDVCKQIRKDGGDVPIIMLTARGQEIDKVVGLKSGADDYVTKPFSFLELVARVEAVLRRTSAGTEETERYSFGDVRLDFSSMEAVKGESPIDLSRREFELLRYMVDHRGKAIPRQRLLEAVWGYNNESYTRTVDMHIAKLRKKVEDDPADPAFIVTVHRVGYKFTG